MEKWKSIEGYENKYLISDSGNVKSLVDKNGEKTNKILKPRIAKNGYLYVNLWKKSKSKTKKIHRLVAEAFIPNPNNCPCINHKDGNKQNNNINNLEWCTYSENAKHAFVEGLSNPLKNLPIPEKGKDNINCKKILQFNLKGEFVKEWGYIKEAQEKLQISHISDVCKGKRKSAGGYVWKYKEMGL